MGPRGHLCAGLRRLRAGPRRLCAGLRYRLHAGPHLRAVPRGRLCAGFVVICVWGLVVCARDHEVICAQGLIVCARGLMVVCGRGLCGARVR